MKIWKPQFERRKCFGPSHMQGVADRWHHRKQSFWSRLVSGLHVPRYLQMQNLGFPCCCEEEVPDCDENLIGTSWSVGLSNVTFSSDDENCDCAAYYASGPFVVTLEVWLSGYYNGYYNMSWDGMTYVYPQACTDEGSGGCDDSLKLSFKCVSTDIWDVAVDYRICDGVSKTNTWTQWYIAAEDSATHYEVSFANLYSDTCCLNTTAGGYVTVDLV